MIHIVTSENEHLYRSEMDQALRLHDRLFGTPECGHAQSIWSRKCNRNAVHTLYIKRGNVLGCQSMVPVAEPPLLPEVSPKFDAIKLPVASHIWELSRQCVEPTHRIPERSKGEIAIALWSSLFEWGFNYGVSDFILDIEPVWLLPLVKLEFHPVPLGLPRKIDGQRVIPVVLRSDGRTLNRIYSLRAAPKDPSEYALPM